jgi:nicotinate-nucleotide pyrophosphorylase (carboxylating)
VHGRIQSPAAVLSQLPADLAEQVFRALREDIGTGDLIARLIPAGTQAQVRVLCRGAPWFDETFRQLDPAVRVRWHAAEGAPVAADTVLCELEGPAGALLTGERIVPNFLQLLSAIAARPASLTSCGLGAKG